MDVTPTPSKFEPPPQRVLMQSHSGIPDAQVDVGRFKWCFSTRLLFFFGRILVRNPAEMFYIFKKIKKSFPSPPQK